MTMRILSATLLGATLLLAPAAHAQRAEVERVALDYIDGFYQGDTAKLVSAFRPEMFKYGFWRDSTGKYTGERMTFPEAIAYAKRVKARKAPVNPKWPRKVEVLDVQDRTAAVKITAWWGTDYLLLGNYDGKWQIGHVMWEGPLKSVQPTSR
jgi:hypothetical protein